MTSDRDPQVAALLDVIEADPPRPGFWEDLERRLAAEPAPALELAQVRPTTGHRRRRMVVGVAAAAAVIAVALGGLILRDDRDATETVPALPGPSVTEPQESRVTYAPDAPQGQAVGYLDVWIRSLVEGDTSHGWELLGPQSQDSLGSQQAYAALLDDLRATWASYANLDAGDATVAQLGSTDAWLVLLRHRTGDPQPMVAVVRLSPAGNPAGHVEPFLPGPALNLISVEGLPQAPGALSPGDFVPLNVDADADIAVVLDADAAPASALEGDPMAGLRLPDSLANGTHLVAVAQQLPSGALAADVRSFQVVGGR